MSQQKVDRYKKEKYSRKQRLAKEKKQRIFYRIAGCASAFAIVGWIGFSVFERVEDSRPVSYTEVSLDAISDYMSAQ